MFHDSGSGSSFTTSVGTTTDLAVPPVTSTPRIDGAHTFDYLPTAALPTPQIAAANRSALTPLLATSATLVPTGAAPVYFAGGEYLHPVGSETFGADAALVLRGLLQVSYDRGHTFRTLRTTTGSTHLTWPGQPTVWGNGRTPRLTRNTWLRWVFPGDAFVRPAVSPTVLVRVAPTISARVSRSGTHRRISGRVARIRGRVLLYLGTKLIASAPIGAAGTFTFGWRSLAHGRYTLVSVPDASWAASRKILSV